MRNGLIVDPRIRAEVVPGHGVLAVSETGTTLFRGAVYEQLLPRLDGRSDAATLAAELGPVCGRPQVHYALARLQSTETIMVRGDSADLDPARLAYWRDLGVDAEIAEARLATASVEIVDLTESGRRSSPGTGLVDAALARAGLPRPATPDVPPGVRLVLVEDYLQPGLAEINAEALRTGTPWLLARPAGREVWIGPVFRPGITGCWECLADRLIGNREVPGLLVSLGVWKTPAAVSAVELPTGQALVAELVAWTLTRAVAIGSGAAQDLRTVDTVTGDVIDHTLVRRPQCAACGDPTPPSSRAVVLPPAPLRDAADGGWRTGSAGQVLSRYEHHVSPITGAVPSLRRVPVGDADLLQVYVAGQNMALPARDLDRLRHSLRSASAGKGVSAAQAKASALAEALERFSGRRRGTEVAIRASFSALGSDAIHPNACQLYSEAQLDAAAEWNAKGSAFAGVPSRFDEDRPVDWTPVWSLTAETTRMLPTGYCYYEEPAERGTAAYVADSNGCAAGANLTEAVLQGFLELVERDAVALWWYHRLERPGVDLADFDDPYLAQLPRQYARLQRDVWALDLTHDLGIPVFAAVSRRPGHDPEDVLFGFGAHFDARLALLRAVTELNQMVSRSPAVAAADTFDRVEAAWARNARVADLAYLRPRSDRPERGRACFAEHPPPDDLVESVAHCRRLVEARGLEMLVLDQTRPDIGLSVAKVFVPGLRHFWARFAPGRLYDVPVRLGWLSEPTPEVDLNPVPMFL